MPGNGREQTGTTTRADGDDSDVLADKEDANSLIFSTRINGGSSEQSTHARPPAQDHSGRSKGRGRGSGIFYEYVRRSARRTKLSRQSCGHM